MATPSKPAGKFVFITGGTGYIGYRLIRLLQSRGHKITAVVRDGSQWRLPEGCEVIVANALDRNTWQRSLKPFHTLIHLVGVAKPTMAKSMDFVDVDLRSARESIKAAQNSRIRHFVYVSVAHPAPVMKEYIMVREGVETAIREAGLRATILRPWYVTGPGRSWPVLLALFYLLAGLIPGIAATARRLGLVSVDQVAKTIAHAVENPPEGIETVEVPGIRKIAKSFH
jgi:uncharacterized protein YbjT (DUF2867 family)